ncbi:MAG: hypothetical protein M0024_10180 [Nitrospiraceae bacterium]|nr:hypothetical protein [Nitrospiraceae bacterium]
MDSNRQNLTLPPNQARAIPLILSARNIAEGCKKARISRDTFYDWSRQPEFKAEFYRQRQEIIDAATHELRMTVGDAVNTLRELLTSNEDSVRLRTAQTLLENILKFTELQDVQERLAAIEQRMEAGR